MVLHTGARRVSRGEEGGAKYFFSGPKCPPSNVVTQMQTQILIILWELIPY